MYVGSADLKIIIKSMNILFLQNMSFSLLGELILLFLAPEVIAIFEPETYPDRDETYSKSSRHLHNL